MSYQHFYSRVPARVSLYNRRDGFDTFAQSAALNPDFVLGELSVLYADKLNLHDPIKVRRGEIPAVYSQTPLPCGVIAQTAIGYIPTDFTGERSAYLAHTLILTDEDREKIFRDNSNNIFNPGMFITDISGFSITATNAVANANCQEAIYRPLAAEDYKEYIGQFNPDMVKSFIYSVLLALCEDGREVFFRLPGEDAEQSANAVRFINCIAGLLPYNLREKISFVSFVSNPDAYPGFKIKGVGSSVTEINPEKGVFYDFTTGMVTGQTVDYEKNQVFASFFYSFYQYPKIKEAFHKFVQSVFFEYDSLTLSIRTVKELSFLFWQCSGFYVEDSVLPSDEAICGLFDIYEKYREGLSVSQKEQSYKCLVRYSKTQTAIPDGVFSRLSGLYPTECNEAKAVALDVLLHIIHLDLMRETIFCFISRNYPHETDEVRALIMSNLASVFYGGFIQLGILAFFDAHFANEPEKTKDVILDKLLLSIRTPEIQRHIVTVLDRHYQTLSGAQKLKICATCLEMIPVCDSLSVLLVDLVNRRLGREGGDVASLLDSKLSEAIYFSIASGNNTLSEMLIEHPGFCEELVLKYAISKRQGFEKIINMLAAMPAHKRAGKLIRAYKVGKSIGTQHYFEFIGRFTEMHVNVAPSTLDEILRQDKLASITLPKSAINSFREAAIYPAVRRTIYHVFKPMYGDGLEYIAKYAENHPAIQNSGEYKSLLEYNKLISKCNLGDAEDAFKIAERFPENEEIRSDIAGYIKSHAYKPDIQDPETSAVYETLIDYLSSGEFNFDGMYERYAEYYEAFYSEDGGIIGGIKSDLRGVSSAIELLITTASGICDASDELATAVMDDDSGLRQAISEYVSFFGPGAGIVLKKKTQDAYFEIEELVEQVIEDRNAGISSVSDAVDFLLRRK